MTGRSWKRLRGRSTRAAFSVPLAVVVACAAVGCRGGSPAAGTSTAATPATAPNVAASPPDCVYGEARATHARYGDWRRTLVDTRFALPDGYSPPDLASTAKAGFLPGFSVRGFVIEDLAALRVAAEAAGNPVEIIAAYRSYSEQRSLFERRVRESGRAVALRHVARPGHSEHQLGTTVDFKAPGAADVDATWASTPEGKWMQQNAWRFGFVQSYPKGKIDVTCYTFEPWHFRYFGRETARLIHESGLTVREYLWANGEAPE